MNAYLVASSSLSLEDVNVWFPPVVDGHLGRRSGICKGLLENGDGNGS